jgi:heme A synthase
MFLVQTGRAKRTRKYSIFMMFVLFLMGGLGGMMAIFTLHWEVRPKSLSGKIMLDCIAFSA